MTSEKFPSLGPAMKSTLVGIIVYCLYEVVTNIRLLADLSPVHGPNSGPVLALSGLLSVSVLLHLGSAILCGVIIHGVGAGKLSTTKPTRAFVYSVFFGIPLWYVAHRFLFGFGGDRDLSGVSALLENLSPSLLGLVLFGAVSVIVIQMSYERNMILSERFR